MSKEDAMFRVERRRDEQEEAIRRQGCKPGSARIIRVDEHNVAVQVYREIEATERTDEGKRVKTGKKLYRWVDAGYYGHRIDHAAESALFLAMQVGEPITAESIRSAVKQITEAHV